MKRFLLFVVLFLMLSETFAQSNALLSGGQSVVKVLATSRDEVQRYFTQFSVDRVEAAETNGEFWVSLCLAKEEYEHFLSMEIPYILVPQSKNRALTMATTVEQMQNWDRYPTLSVYLQMMQNFQAQYPNLCDIDTILAETPEGRPILVAHLTQNVAQSADKPQFWYASAMHGDEITSIVLMLRLIDYLLSNYGSDAEVTQILNSIDLWISPMDNPDGTFYGSENSTSVSNSRRANSQGIDLNRSFRKVPYGGYSFGSNIPEVVAMEDFADNHNFVLSANFHGGTEVVNYPFDFASTSNGGRHADNDWWVYVSNQYADTCQAQDENYFVFEYSSGITQGGNWYVIDGSRQDYMNYYKNCREVTLEISVDKQLSTNRLNDYWNYNKRSLLNYIKEVNYGFKGHVFDAETLEPIEAMVYVNDHDIRNSQVYSSLPFGSYFRPIKAGTYSVTVTADCYQPHSFSVVAQDETVSVHDVFLRKITVDPIFAKDTFYTIENQTVSILNISATTCNTTNWYDSPTSNTPIFTGNLFETPQLYTTTTFYAETVGVGDFEDCRSERVPVTVAVVADACSFLTVDSYTPTSVILGDTFALSVGVRNVGTLPSSSATLVRLFCDDSDLLLLDTIVACNALEINNSIILDDFLVYAYSDITESKTVMLRLEFEDANCPIMLVKYLPLDVIGIDCDATTSVTAVAGPSHVSLSWQPVAGAVTYKLFRDDLLIADNLETTTFVDENLPAGVRFGYKVMSECARGYSSLSTPVFAAATGNVYLVPETSYEEITTCTATIYDHAGADANYESNRNGYLIVHSADTISRLQIYGTYNTEADYDFLYIYDGLGGEAPLLGAFSGSGTIQNLISSDSLITIRFKSDQYVTEAGFELFVSCLPNCDTVLTTIYAVIGREEVYSENGFFAWEPGTYVQRLYTDEGCDSTVVLCLTIEGVEIVENTNFLEVEIYPNPATSEFMVQSTFPFQNVRIYNAVGEMVTQFSGNGDLKQIFPINNLEAGVYFINIIANQNVITKKLVVR